MTWRDEQKAATRRAILDTFRDLSLRADATPVSVAEVARESGIAPATIYRHFPNRDALVHAAAVEHMYVGVAAELTSWGLAHASDHLRALWGSFVENVNMVRESSVSEAGREMRRTRLVAQQDELRRALELSGVDPDGLDGRRYGILATLLMSAHAFLDLHDRHELSVDESVDAVCWAIGVLAEHLGIDHDVLWHGGTGRTQAADDSKGEHS